MKTRISSRRIWAISLPIILAGANETLVEVTDTIFLSRFGMIELGAVALAAAIYEVLSFVTFGLGDGIQIVCARRAGQEDEAGIGAAFNQGVALLMTAAVALFFVLLFVAPLVTGWVLRSDEVRAAVDAFLGIIAFAVFFHGLNLAWSAFYVGIARTRILIWVTLALALTNIVLDYVLIFGHFGLPRLGIRGAAMASVAAEVVACVGFLAYAAYRGDLARYGLFRFRGSHAAVRRVIARVSWPVALESLVGTARWFLFFVMIEQLGEAPLAAANVVYSIYALLLLPIDGFSETTVTLVSGLIGRDATDQIGSVLRRISRSTLILVLPFVLLALLLPELPLSLFSSDPEVLSASVTSLRVVVAAVLIVIPAEMVFSAVAGTGDTRSTLLIELALSVTVVIWVYVTGLVLGLPLAVVWLGEIVGWTVCFALSTLWWRRGRWRELEI